MRRAAALAVEVAGRAGAQPLQETLVCSQGLLGSLSLVRGMAGGPPPIPQGEKTILQKVVPEVINAFPKAAKLITKATKGAVHGLLASEAVRSGVTRVADSLLINETFLDLKSVDVVPWTHWLATAGYQDPSGWKKLANVFKEKLKDGGVKPAEVETIVAALHAADYYDKDLFDLVAAHVSENFMQYDTPGVAKMIHAFSENGHYSVDLFDDFADSITYCNHYFAPMELPITDITNIFKAFAKYCHDRADLFNMLARAIDEDKINLLESDKEFAYNVMHLLMAFDSMHYWPECSEAIVLVAQQFRPHALSPVEHQEVEKVVKKLEAMVGGELEWLRGGWKEQDHFHGAAFKDYNLHVFRDNLVRQYYSPSSVTVLKDSPGAAA